MELVVGCKEEKGILKCKAKEFLVGAVADTERDFGKDFGTDWKKVKVENLTDMPKFGKLPVMLKIQQKGMSYDAWVSPLEQTINIELPVSIIQVWGSPKLQQAVNEVIKHELVHIEQFQRPEFFETTEKEREKEATKRQTF